MTPLRRRMVEDMNLSPETRYRYILAVEKFTQTADQRREEIGSAATDGTVARCPSCRSGRMAYVLLLPETVFELPIRSRHLMILRPAPPWPLHRRHARSGEFCAPPATAHRRMAKPITGRMSPLQSTTTCGTRSVFASGRAPAGTPRFPTRRSRRAIQSP